MITLFIVLPLVAACAFAQTRTTLKAAARAKARTHNNKVIL